jgi:O-antigen/teichoic acid export membrane protein
LIITTLKNRFAQGVSSKLARDTAIMSLGQASRLVLQALCFVAVARTLGSQQYGAFVAIVAIVGIASPFAGVGGSSVLLKYVSVDRELIGVYWGNGILLILASGSIFTLIVVTFGPRVIGSNLRVAIICVAFSELILARTVDLASFAWAALGRMHKTALLNVYVSLSRLVCILLLSLVKARPNVQEWCIAVLFGSIACCLYSFWGVSRVAGIAVDLGRLRQSLTEGAFFAAGGSAATFYNDIDKTMLARMSDMRSTGIYGAAYRLIDVSMAPIKAMTSSAYAEFFRQGVKGPKATSAYAYKLIKHAAPFGAIVFVGAIAGAPMVAWILGKDFRNSVEALRWLAILPLMRCGHYFLGDALSGAGLNATRTIIQIIVAVTNVGLNLYFIRHWSWRGAAWTSILCDGLLVAGFATALAIVQRYPRYSRFNPGAVAESF